MNKVFIIGDIHGRLKALKQVWERAQITEKDKVIFLGDYVDRGPESAEVIDFLISKKEQSIFIKGNHDEWFLEFLNYKTIDNGWYEHGGAQTLASYDNYLNSKLQKHHQFLQKNLIPYYIDENNNAFVHGGYITKLGSDHESAYYWDRELVHTSYYYPNNEENNILLKQYNKIFVGHTPTISFDINKNKPIIIKNLHLLDTGAGFKKGKLTAYNLESCEIFQSDLIEDLYK